MLHAAHFALPGFLVIASFELAACPVAATRTHRQRAFTRKISYMARVNSVSARQFSFRRARRAVTPVVEHSPVRDSLSVQSVWQHRRPSLKGSHERMAKLHKAALSRLVRACRCERESDPRRSVCPRVGIQRVDRFGRTGPRYGVAEVDRGGQCPMLAVRTAIPFALA